MDEFMTYVVELLKSQQAGLLGNYAEPAEPSDLGDPLTQDEIDFVKKLKKEIDERFTEV